MFFFFQAEDGIRDIGVTGVQTCALPICSQNPLRKIAEGTRCTWFLTQSNPVAARKTWIAGALEPKGVLTIDTGAAQALMKGASLLPVGVRRIEGDFARGDAVVIRDTAGNVLGRGLVGYDAEEAGRIIGR